MKRLMVYETDKGNYAVRPEHWAGIIDKNGRIKECGLNHTAIFHYKDDAEWYADAKNAEEQGLLLRLPCKVGDTVYILAGRFGAFYEEDICDGFYIGRDGILQVKVQNHKGNHGTYGVVDKTIFLTIEEAEQALARMEKENG